MEIDVIPPPPPNRRAAAGKAARFALVAAVILAGAIVILAIASRTGVFVTGFHIGLALVVGVAGSILLGVGLMALSFYSERSGADDAVVNLSDDEAR
jgi:hypothetical protein